MRIEIEKQGGTVRDYLAVVRRRKWTVIAATLVIPILVGLLTAQQQKLYASQAEVLLSRQNLASALSGVADASLTVQADRVAQTQADLASTPTVAARTLKSLKLTDRTAEDLLAHASVTARANADILSFQVTDPSQTLAPKLATQYAREYTIYRRQLDTDAIARARVLVQAKLDELEQQGERKTALYSNLVEKEQQLGTLETLQTSNAYVVRRAQGAAQVQPRISRNVILGVLLGLAVGLGLAFLRESLDTRVRTAEEIRDRLGGLPLLARLAAPPRHLQRDSRPVMLAEPSNYSTEAFRMLRTNLEFSRLDREARVLLFTSSVAQEGKSTTISNLAVALGRAGQRVILIDLDLRRPFLEKFFQLPADAKGVTQVALGHAELDEALSPIDLSVPGAEKEPRSDRRLGGGVAKHGSLHVMPSGPIPPDPGEFVATKALAGILDELRTRADVVLVDAPPLLQVGDAMTLGNIVDGIVVVTRMNVVKRPMLVELYRQLEAQPAPRLGFVVTDAKSEEGASYEYTYGYGYGYGAARAKRRFGRRRLRKGRGASTGA